MKPEAFDLHSPTAVTDFYNAEADYFAREAGMFRVVLCSKDLDPAGKGRAPCKLEKGHKGGCRFSK